MKNTTTIYAMFYNCISLISLPDLTNLDKEKIFDINYNLYGCNLLESLLYISKWDTKEMIKIDSSYFDSFLLNRLDDLSDCEEKVIYETIEEKDISNSDSEEEDDFDLHKKLKFRKRKEKKIAENTVDMSYMFHGCSSLKSIPDFFIFYLKNKVTNVTGMFGGCTSLKAFNELPKWNNRMKKNSLFVEDNDKIIAKKVKNC